MTGDVVERSDQLDEKLMLITVRRHRALYAFLAFLVVFQIGQFIELARLSRSNHRVLTSQIPALVEQIKARDDQIAQLHGQVSDLNYVIQKAVAAILKEAAEIRRLGGTPPNIVLKPPSHP